MKKLRVSIGILTALAMIVADRIIKIKTSDGFRHNYHYLRWTILHNYGAAGGLLSGHRVFLVTVGILVTAFLCTLPKIMQTRSVWFWLGWGLTVGGAIGNLWDRVVYGYVIDMFQFHHQDGVFNASDIAIHFGMILMLASYGVSEAVLAWRKRRMMRRQTATQSPTNGS